MCFVPQRRALFRHLKCQKWSAPLVLLTFWLGNVLRATTACTFSTSQLPKVVRTWCALYILTWKCAYFSSLLWPAGSAPAALASLLFDPPEPQIILGKHSESRLSYLFAHLHLLFLTLSLLLFSLLIFLFSLPLPCSAFHLSILSEVWLLNFLRQLPHLPTQRRLVSDSCFKEPFSVFSPSHQAPHSSRSSSTSQRGQGFNSRKNIWPSFADPHSGLVH